MIVAWLGVALAGAPAVPPATWVALDRERAVCLSGLPSAGRLRGRDGEAVARALAAVGAGEPLPAEVGRTKHAAGPALVASLDAAAGGDPAPLLALAEAWQRDGCLQAAAALAMLDRGDPDGARRLLGRAWLTERHPEVARLLARALLAQGELERASEVVDKGLALDRAHPGLAKLRVLLAARTGRALDALDALEALAASGDHDLDDQLLLARFAAGRIDDYLRLAAERGAPLAGADLGAGSALQALRSHLGLTDPEQRLEARLHTTEGTLRCVLFVDEAPVTVANFVGLATGRQPWTAPDGSASTAPLYPGTIFHRVIPGFMIQGGDPEGRGTGGPGYDFHDEIVPALRFDRAGRLAMANSGPATNGSQFFVTEAPTPHLDGRHTVFGQCVPAEVVAAISGVSRGADDRPMRDVVLERVELLVLPR